MLTILRLILQRLILGAATLAVISLIVFFGIELLPGDPAAAILGKSATAETLAAFRHEMHLDLPAWQRYAIWASDVLHGDFGRSIATGRSIDTLIGGRLANTFFLAAYAALIAVPLALGLGVLAALHRNSVFDRVVNLITLTAISFPEFFVAYILVYLLAVSVNLFPGITSLSPDLPLWDRLFRSTLPALTLTLVVVAHMMRMTRAAIISLMSSPYIEMARLKGIGKVRIVLRHALPNALAPIINVVALNLAYLVVGVVVVEVVFAYPGLGQLLVDAVSTRDVPLVQVCSLIFAATYILLNLTADILSIMSNPRLLHSR
ncbi:MAG: ABC transporter permease [Notoacmeibacter sp.]|nr:ABC transporter permease [Notoacmeibacter sp.]